MFISTEDRSSETDHCTGRGALGGPAEAGHGRGRLCLFSSVQNACSVRLGVRNLDRLEDILRDTVRPNNSWLSH